MVWHPEHSNQTVACGADDAEAPHTNDRSKGKVCFLCQKNNHAERRRERGDGEVRWNFNDHGESKVVLHLCRNNYANVATEKSLPPNPSGGARNPRS